MEEEHRVAIGLKERIDKAHQLTRPFREVRNRLIAHTELGGELKPYPEFSRTKVNVALEGIKDVLLSVHNFYSDFPTIPQGCSNAALVMGMANSL